ncbi:MAG: ABC transporter ATP-binding protein [Desulfurococcales archaeon]|nr:ABC transporter ATP-binding protein [Desulfurococcales archaeon]
MRGIEKVYPDGVKALDNVEFEVCEGEIHGLLGENGAGKTTLMRILYGEIKPTRGEVRVFGEKVSFHGPWEAIRKDIGMVYQHFALVPTFTVAENLFLSYLSIKPKANIMEALDKARQIMDETGLKFPLNTIVENLPVGLQQRVEIVKALSRDARILILDEPTSVLTPVEVEELFTALKKLKDNGITIIFITHKLREVLELADRITVLRKGKRIGTIDAGKATPKILAEMMIGKSLRPTEAGREGVVGETLLKVENLVVLDGQGVTRVDNLSFELKSGEILGVAGVQGNGQSELAESIAGILKPVNGSIILKSEDVTDLCPSDRYRLGLGYVPESRKKGLVSEMSVTENVVLTNLHLVLSKGRMIQWSKARSISGKIVRYLDVKTPSLDAIVKYLSGGNQQKIMVGREVVRESDVIVVAEPTQGLDISATRFIRNTLLKLRGEGKAILLISSDLDEIYELSDRIAVIYEGRFIGIGTPDELTRDRIGMLMGGVEG